MKEFHCVLANEGGVGESLVASWLMHNAKTAGYEVLGNGAEWPE